MSTCKCTIHMNYTMLMINLLVKQIIDVVVCNVYLHQMHISQSQEFANRHTLFGLKSFLSKISQMDQFWASERMHAPLFLVPTLGATTFDCSWFDILWSLLNSKEYIWSLFHHLSTLLPIMKTEDLVTYLKPQLFQVLCSHVIFNFCPGYPFNFKYHA